MMFNFDHLCKYLKYMKKPEKWAKNKWEKWRLTCCL